MTNIKQIHALAQQAINRRDWGAAHGFCLQIIQQQDNHADAYFLLGIVNAELGQFNKAVQLIEKAISFDAQVEYFVHLAKCYAVQGNMNSALQAAKNAPVHAVNNALSLDTLGVALSRIGLHEQALSYFEKALSLQQNHPAFYYNYAVSCKFAGKFAEARQAFELAIALKPDYFQAHFALADLGGMSEQHNHIARLEPWLNKNLAVDEGLHLAHALAKEYQALGRHSAAFELLSQRKRAKLASLDYQFEQDKALFDAARQQYMQANLSSASLSDRPIFVVGMPRSGTTLVERIISSHSEVRSCGELQDFGVAVKELTKTPGQKVLDVNTLNAAYQLNFADLGQRYLDRTAAVAGNARHFIDKLPFNFFYIPLIRQALPKAKIVCLLRDPMDTCIGNFRQLFSLNSPYYAYAYDLMTTARFYAEFYHLARHWQTVGGDNFLVLDYQQLVEEPEPQIRHLIEFCGLKWQENCLHVERNQAPVSTASKVQVREPINSRSVGRWKKFKPYTDEIEAFFKEQGIPFI